MGLKCSRQGYIQDFHDLEDIRLAPEGECIPVDNIKNANSLGMRIQPNAFQYKLAAILQDQTLTRKISESILFQTEDTSFWKPTIDDLKIVDLPPEGKVANLEYVELPHRSDDVKQSDCDVKKSNDDVFEDQHIVELPAVTNGKDEIVEYKGTAEHRYIFEDVCNQQIAADRRSSDEGCSQNAADFRRIFTKNIDDKDEQRHPRSDVVESYNTLLKDRRDSACDNHTRAFMDVPAFSMDHNNCESGRSTEPPTATLTKHEMLAFLAPVDIEHRRHHRNRNHSNINGDDNDDNDLTIKNGHTERKTSKSAKKYSAYREYNGMIFPPRNSSDAEKINNYIEKKLAKHRRRSSSSGDVKNRQDGEKRCICKCKSNEVKRSRTTASSRDEAQFNVLSKSPEVNQNSFTTRLLVHRSYSHNDRDVIHSDVVHSAHDDIITPPDDVTSSSQCDVLPKVQREVINKQTVNIQGSLKSHSSHLSGTDTPQSCDEVFTDREQRRKEESPDNPRNRHATSRSFSRVVQRKESDEEQVFRFRHACSCQQNRKPKFVHCENIFSRRSNRCDEYEKSSIHVMKRRIHRTKSPVSDDSSCGENETMSTYISPTPTPATLQHRRCREMHRRKLVEKSPSTSSENENETRPMLIDLFESQRRPLNNQGNIREFSSIHQNETQQCSNRRPDVWPGCSLSTRDITNIDRQNGSGDELHKKSSNKNNTSLDSSTNNQTAKSATDVLQQSRTFLPQTTKDNHSDNNTKTEHLCLCKRMLGTSYPCDHKRCYAKGQKQRPPTCSNSKRVHHKHKHEHLHFHYYVPRDGSSCDISR